MSWPGKTTAASGSNPSPASLCQLADIPGVAPHALTTTSPDQARLGDLRAWRGMTQRELADAIGMPASTLAAIETGRRPLHGHQAAAIAEVLGVSPEQVRDADRRARQD